MISPPYLQTELSREFSACWHAVVSACPVDVRDEVARVIQRHRHDISAAFYAEMRELPRARPFLDHEVVNRRLRASMSQWLVDALSGSQSEEFLDPFIARQLQLGAIHARIRMPLDLLSRSTRVIMDALLERIAFDGPLPDARYHTYRYVNHVLHLCDELMTIAYVTESQRAVRVDEAYHLFAQRREALLERERQRALLSEWTQDTLFSIGTPSRRGTVTSLSASDFGLWLHHKGRSIFSDDPDLAHVQELVAHVDAALLPQLRQRQMPIPDREKLLEALATKLELIRYVMADLFTRVEKSEHSIDALTRLPNSRYLPAVISREIDEHATREKPFSLLLLRPPHLGEVGLHETADAKDVYLQKCSTSILSTIRPSDHLFRYHEDQFLIIYVEADLDAANALALRVQTAIHQEVILRAFHTPGFGVSVGIAEFDGHPDPADLLRRAEIALVDAIQSGDSDAIMHA